MIRKTFESYMVSKEWLDDNQKKREAYFNMNNKSAPSSINYEDYLKTDSKQNDYRLSIISDKLYAWDKRYQRSRKLCLDVMQICEIWLEMVHKENREIIRLAFMLRPITHEDIALIIGTERSTITKIIDREIAYLTSLSQYS